MMEGHPNPLPNHSKLPAEHAEMIAVLRMNSEQLKAKCEEMKLSSDGSGEELRFHILTSLVNQQLHDRMSNTDTQKKELLENLAAMNVIFGPNRSVLAIQDIPEGADLFPICNAEYEDRLINLTDEDISELPPCIRQMIRNRAISRFNESNNMRERSISNHGFNPEFGWCMKRCELEDEANVMQTDITDQHYGCGIFRTTRAIQSGEELLCKGLMRKGRENRKPTESDYVLVESEDKNVIPFELALTMNDSELSDAEVDV